MRYPWRNCTEKPCPCHDPVVFGHHEPCPRWETRANLPALPGFRSMDISAAFADTAETMRLYNRTLAHFNALLRETADAISQCQSSQTTNRGSSPANGQDYGPA